MREIFIIIVTKKDGYKSPPNISLTHPTASHVCYILTDFHVIECVFFALKLLFRRVNFLRLKLGVRGSEFTFALVQGLGEGYILKCMRGRPFPRLAVYPTSAVGEVALTGEI